MEPQVFDVLVHLIRHRDRVVTKDELFDAVWRTRFARLVDWNLVSLRTGPVSRYRVLETIRQFALDMAQTSGEVVWLRAAHLAWCHATLTLLQGRDPGDEVWCGEVDEILDDARAALAWADD
jgi:hypothetical protein